MTNTPRFPGSPFPDYGLPLLEEATTAKPAAAAPPAAQLSTGWDAAFANVDAKHAPAEGRNPAVAAASGWDRAFQRKQPLNERD